MVVRVKYILQGGKMKTLTYKNELYIIVTLQKCSLKP